MELIVAETPKAAARALAGRITVLARQAMGRRGVCNVALAGGPEASLLFEALVNTEIFWGRVNVFQAEEVVAPDGHPARRATALVDELADQVGLPPGRLHLIEAGAADPAAAARRYAATLPEQLDVVQFGLVADDRTDPWPADATFDGDERVAVVGGVGVPGAAPGTAGATRIVLTPAAVNAAEHRFVLAVGAEHRDALARLLAADPGSGPARLADPVTVYADRAAAGTTP